MSAATELQKIIDADIRFTMHQEDSGRFLVKLGDYRRNPDAQAVVDTFEEAVAWLREEVKSRYPNVLYSRIRLTS